MTIIIDMRHNLVFRRLPRSPVNRRLSVIQSPETSADNTLTILFQ